MKNIVNIPPVKRIAVIYFQALAIFTAYRLILLLTQSDKVSLNMDVTDIAVAFLIGIRFDSVIICSILIIPYLILTLLYFFRQNKPAVSKIIYLYIIVLFCTSFFISAVDLPYFNHFFSRLSVAAFQWLDSPAVVFTMIIREKSYWIAIVPFIISIMAFSFFSSGFSMKKQDHFLRSNASVIVSQALICLLFLGFFVVGIRGRLEFTSPIRVGTAYFSTNGFLNQLGLNPTYTLMRSIVDKFNEENRDYYIMDSNKAVHNVQGYFNINPISAEYPIMRKVEFGNSSPQNYNVIIIIMESMQAAKMKRHGNRYDITPFLDRIADEGLYFENAYTAGVSTHHGIFSTLFSFPAIYKRHAMKNVSMLKYDGIASTLKKNSYSTIYFTTHDGQFDNIEGFLRANDFDQVISKHDYPLSARKTAFGVPDDYMFEFSMPFLNDLHQKNKPFFAVFLTTSDHKPYYIPEYFKPKTSHIKNQIVEYADYSLQKFIALCMQEPWFENTLFVFVADHGLPLESDYDLSLDYHHTPLIFYAPSIIKEPRIFENYATQMDIFPTIMGILKIPYINNALGMDLLSWSRAYSFFCEYDKFGVINDDWFLIARNDGTLSLYKYREKDTRDYSADCSSIVEEMKEYAESHMQTYLFLVKENRQYNKDIHD